MELISRKEAKALGLQYYFTGKPCSHGHVAKRHTSNWMCVVCTQAHNDSRDHQTDKVREYNMAYYWANHAACRKARNKRNIERRQTDLAWANAEYKRLTQYRNSPEGKAWAANYYAENKYLYFAKAAERRAHLAGGRTKLTSEEQRQVLDLYKLCRRMNKEAGFPAYHVDHIHPLKHGGKHHPDNLRIITAEENMKKGTKLLAT